MVDPCRVALCLAVSAVVAAVCPTPSASEAGAATLKNVEPAVRVLSFNIRYDNPGDGDNAWPYRKDRVASVIRLHGADLAGLQEAQKHQIDDLVARLPGEYAWFGVGRDDGAAAGEFNPIFYRDDRFELLEQDTFWLSETPDVPSKGWDAAIVRICTWGMFRKRDSNVPFYVFNTHFDHVGVTARRESARLVGAKIGEIAGPWPALLTGDFNTTPGSEPYVILTTEAGLADAQSLSAHPHHGPSGTLAGFDYTGIPGGRIDFVFAKNGVTVSQHGVLADTWEGRMPSDHMPVLAEIAVEAATSSLRPATRSVLRAMTFNIRLDTAADGEDRWDNRRDMVASMLRFYRVDVAGLQEALLNQIHDLVPRLPEHAWLGVGRDDGAIQGEFCAIFYRPERLELLEQSTFWLSETPWVISRGWDAALKRICTWARFRERATGMELFVFNTHFDHVGQVAREESARLVKTKMEEIAGEHPALLMGDLNFSEGAAPYPILVGDGTLLDGQYHSLQPHHGCVGTSSGFRFNGRPGGRIDYVFLRNPSLLTITQHATLSDTWDRRMPSDHLPVVAELQLDRAEPTPLPAPTFIHLR